MEGKKEWGRTLLRWGLWNGLMYALVQWQDWFLVGLLYLLVTLLVTLKALIGMNIAPVSFPKPDTDYYYTQINTLCTHLHTQMKGAKVLLIAWIGVKIAVYSRLLGTLGVIWLGGNIALLQKSLLTHYKVDLVASILAFRRRVLRTVLDVCKGWMGRKTVKAEV